MGDMMSDEIKRVARERMNGNGDVTIKQMLFYIDDKFDKTLTRLEARLNMVEQGILQHTTFCKTHLDGLKTKRENNKAKEGIFRSNWKYIGTTIIACSALYIAYVK